MHVWQLCSVVDTGDHSKGWHLIDADENPQLVHFHPYPSFGQVHVYLAEYYQSLILMSNSSCVQNVLRNYR